MENKVLTVFYNKEDDIVQSILISEEQENLLNWLNDLGILNEAWLIIASDKLSEIEQI